MKQRLFLMAALLAACPLTVLADDTAPADAPATAPVVTPGPGTGQAVTLRFKFTPGQTLYYRMTTDTDGTILTGQTGTGIPLKNHMEMVIHQTVKSVRADDGAATLATGIDSMSMTATVNGQILPLPQDSLPQLKNVGTTLILPTGKVLSFTPDPALASAKSMPGMDVTHANVYGSLGQLPDVPIKAGDSWKSVVTATLAGAHLATGFTLTSVDTTGGKNIAVVNQTMDGDFDTSAAKADPAGDAPKSVTGKINGTGVLRFDVDAGFLDSMTSQMNMDMTGGDGPTAGMNIQMKVNTTMKRVTVVQSRTPASPVQ